MLELVVFLCGAAVMVIELVGSRILAPALGTSVVVWTSIIGVILAALSLGYWWGRPPGGQESVPQGPSRASSWGPRPARPPWPSPATSSSR